MARRQRLIGLFCSAVGAASLYAQAADSVAFETASVKQATARGAGQGVMRGGPRTSSPGQFTATAVTLRALISKAYKLRDFQIAGPDWLSTERYDINAKLPPDTTPEQFLIMIQDLIMDRFHFAFHRDTQDSDGYALRALKSGMKILSSKASEHNSKPSSSGEYFLRKDKDGFPEIPPDQTEIVSLNGRAKLQAHQATMDKLAEMLALELNSAVLNSTGIDGRYDFAITWVRYQPRASASPAIGEESLPTIFTAVSTLGLKLERAKVPVEKLVVDRVDRVPTEN
jgi:uncharacterized protein (TIGR03435 family)